MKPPVVIEFDESRHKYTVNGLDVPSVTQVLGETSPPGGLTWWAMRVGFYGVVELVKQGKLAWPVVQTIEDARALYDKRLTDHEKVKALIEKLVIAERLSCNHVRDDKGTIGTSIHHAVVRLGAGEDPELQEFPPDDRGYIAGMWDWWTTWGPEFHDQEVIVGSAKHGYAGRFDATVVYEDDEVPEATTGDPEQAVIDPDDPEPPDLDVALRPARTLVDFKTSGDVRADSHIQLSAYELAHRECGGTPHDRQEIVHLLPDGTFRRIRGRARPEMFLTRLAAYQTDRELAELLKPPKKKKRRSKA